MLPALAITLLANALFNVLVWPRFYRRVSTDPRARDSDGRATAFLRVHAILIGFALALAATSAVLGVVALIGVR